MSRFIEYDPDQVYLLPPAMTEWLPQEHVVHFVRDAVEVLDLSELYSGFVGEMGRPAYSPRMLVAVWIYAHMCGIRSSRRVETALYENIGFRVLSGNQQPNFWTLNNFRTRHRETLKGLLVQTIAIAQKNGLVKLDQVAIDGTRIQANASKHSAMSYGKMPEKEKALADEIDRYLNECDKTDRQEDDEVGPRRGGELPEHLRLPARRLEAIRKAKAELEEEARRKAHAEQEKRRKQAESEDRPFRPRKDPDKAVPDPKAQRNFTDPESRILAKKGKDIIQGYNAQAAVDAESQIIVAADLTNMAADCPHLLSMLEQVVANTGQVPKELTADAGYFSEANVAGVEAAYPRMNVLIPPDRQQHSEASSPLEKDEEGKADEVEPNAEGSMTGCLTDEPASHSDALQSSPAEEGHRPVEHSALQGAEYTSSDALVGRDPDAGSQKATDEGTQGIETRVDDASSSAATEGGRARANDNVPRDDIVTPNPGACGTVAQDQQKGGGAPATDSARTRMRQKLDTEEGRQRYKLRRCSIEPVFGQIKGARGLRQFLHRGQDKTGAMWGFDCAVHNLLKLFRAGVRLVLAYQ